MPLANNLEASIGTSVSDTSPEKAIAAASVMPNSVNSRPRLPGMNEIGTNTATSTTGGRDDGEADLPRALDGGQQRRLAEFHAPHDVFQHDDGVVHHESDGEHRAQQRQRVDGVAQRRHDQEGGDDRHRNGHRGNERGPHRAEEREDDDQHHDQRHGQRLAGPPSSSSRMKIEKSMLTSTLMSSGTTAAQPLDLLGDRPVDGQHVGLGLGHDAQADARDAVGARHEAVVLGPRPGPRPPRRGAPPSCPGCGR